VKSINHPPTTCKKMMELSDVPHLNGGMPALRCFNVLYAKEIFLQFFIHEHIITQIIKNECVCLKAKVIFRVADIVIVPGNLL
jgi:hypothetical protein